MRSQDISPAYRKRLAEGIYWERSLPLVKGCTPIRQGCDGCWLADEAHRRARHPLESISALHQGLTTPDRKFNGTVRLNEAALQIPLHIRRPTNFCIWSDLLHPSVPFEYIARALDMMCDARCEQHDFLILTKRPDRWQDFLEWHGEYWPGDSPFSALFEVLGRLPDNIYPGATVCNQEEADGDIPYILRIPSNNLWISYEPALGPVDFSDVVVRDENGELHIDALHCDVHPEDDEFYGRTITGIVAGGRTGSQAIPAHPDWFRKNRDDCEIVGRYFFFKGWGEWRPSGEFPEPATHGIFPDGSFYRAGNIVRVDSDIGHEIAIKHKGQQYELIRRVGKKKAGRILDGRTHDQLPWVKPSRRMMNINITMLK